MWKAKSVIIDIARRLGSGELTTEEEREALVQALTFRRLMEELNNERILESSGAHQELP